MVITVKSHSLIFLTTVRPSQNFCESSGHHSEVPLKNFFDHGNDTQPKFLWVDGHHSEVPLKIFLTTVMTQPKFL